MAVSPTVWLTIDEQRLMVHEINDERVIHLSKNIAYYSAMIDAAEADPLDDPDDHQEVLTFLRESLQRNIEEYQQLVNDLL